MCYLLKYLFSFFPNRQIINTQRFEHNMMPGLGSNYLIFKMMDFILPADTTSVNILPIVSFNRKKMCKLRMIPLCVLPPSF